MTFPLRKIFVISIGLLVAFAFFEFSFREVLFDDVKNVLFTQTQMSSVLIALFFYSLFFLLKTYRWRTLLHCDDKISFSRLLSYVLIAYSGSVILPMQLGEVFRVGALKQHHDVSMSFSLTGITIEKALDVTVIVLFAMFAVGLSGVGTDSTKDWLILVALVLSGVLMTLLAVYRLLLGLLSQKHKLTLHATWERTLVSLLKNVKKAFTLVKKQVLRLALQSILMWLVLAASLYFVILAIGLELSWWMVFILLFYSAVGLMLPTAPGFIGTIQGMFVLALLPLGFEQPEVLAAAILYNAMITLFPLLLALFAAFYLLITRRFER